MHRRRSFARLPGAAPIVPKNSIAGRSLTVGRRHHDIPGLAHDRSRDAGGQRGERLAVGSGPRSHHSGAARARPQHRCRRSRRRPTSRAPRRGVAEVRAFTKEESARLVEPWLGAGLALDDLPIPRLIVVKLTSGVAAGFHVAEPSACGTRSDIEPRRSSPLDRTHAHYGRNGGDRLRRGVGLGRGR